MQNKIIIEEFDSFNASGIPQWSYLGGQVGGRIFLSLTDKIHINCNNTTPICRIMIKNLFLHIIYKKMIFLVDFVGNFISCV